MQFTLRFAGSLGSDSSNRSGWGWVLLTLGLFACCGLPFLLIAGGMLMVALSNGNLPWLVAGVVILAAALVSYAVLRKKRKACP